MFDSFLCREGGGWVLEIEADFEQFRPGHTDQGPQATTTQVPTGYCGGLYA